MKCPNCHQNGSRVVDSRPADNGHAIRRRRECENCGFRFTTFERVEAAPLLVIKKNGAREEFNREKVLRGVDKAWIDAIVADTDKNDAKFAKRLAAGKTDPKFGYYGALLPIQEYFEKHPDTYLVSEGANTLDIGRNLIAMKLPRHRLDTGTWGVMGVGLGYAIATAVETGKPVVALEGDSAFGFDGMEMETICRYNLPITVVVVNNGGIYNGTDQEVPSQPGPTKLDSTAKYELLAQAFGGDSYFVSDYQTMEETFSKAVDSKRPCLINVQIDPSMGKESGHIGNLNPEDITEEVKELKETVKN